MTTVRGRFYADDLSPTTISTISRASTGKKFHIFVIFSNYLIKPTLSPHTVPSTSTHLPTKLRAKKRNAHVLHPTFTASNEDHLHQVGSNRTQITQSEPAKLRRKPATMDRPETHFRKARKKAPEPFIRVRIDPAKAGAFRFRQRELIANCTIMCAANDCCKTLADLRYEWYPESHVNCNQQNELEEFAHLFAFSWRRCRPFPRRRPRSHESRDKDALHI